MSAIVIGVAGASGGLGSSTAAAHLAWRAELPATCLVDADPQGALDVTAGVDHVEGPRWGTFIHLEGEADGRRIRQALPRTNRYAVLAGSDGDVPLAAVMAVLSGLCATADLVVVDLRRLPSAPGSLGIAFDLVVLLAGLGVSHLADAERAAARLRHQQGAVQLVTRGPRRLADVGASVAHHVGLPLLGHWADDAAVPRDLERGVPPGDRTHGFDAIADRVLMLTEGHRAVA